MKLTPVKSQHPKATIEDGIELCKLIYSTSEVYGLFPALTGGLLYKDGDRKDIDIVLYRHRQKVESLDVRDFEPLLSVLGVKVRSTHGFVTKCEWKGFEVDIFNPESSEDLGNYGE